MLLRISATAAAALFAASMASARAPHDNSVEVSFTSPVQIPEAVLQPGKYTFDLEDHLADRAIVKVTEPGGAQHYLLTVPTDKLPKTKGIIYFKSAADAKVIHGWECPTCTKPLEFVYPKDEAVKLTASTGKPILAFDPSYDKLPDNLSPEDRKVVTLWLLSPKTVSASGQGEGLTAAKYSTAPKLTATNSEAPPKRMPKTASNVYAELGIGLAILTVGAALPRRRKQQL